MNTQTAASQAFDIDANAQIQDRTVLISTFGSEIGLKLYGAAVKLSNRYGIDLDDVTQEIALAALEVLTDYGFCHINTAVNKTKDALAAGSNYGVNRYYSRKGVSEVSIDQDDDQDDESGDSWVLAFADESFDWDTIDTALSVQAEFARIEDGTDRLIANYLAEGKGPVEVQAEIGLHYSAVIRRRDRRLSQVFEGILA